MTWGWSFECVLRDCWVGVFWKWELGEYLEVLHIWVCLLPCLPIHLVRAREKP